MCSPHQQVITVRLVEQGIAGRSQSVDSPEFYVPFFLPRQRHSPSLSLFEETVVVLQEVI